MASSPTAQGRGGGGPGGNGNLVNGTGLAGTGTTVSCDQLTCARTIAPPTGRAERSIVSAQHGNAFRQAPASTIFSLYCSGSVHTHWAAERRDGGGRTARYYFWRVRTESLATWGKKGN